MRAASALILFSAVVSSAQEPPPTSFPVEAQIVHVHVAVTDSRGRPVRDLGPDDFVLYEDGRAVPIVAFRGPLGARAPSPTAAAPAGPRITAPEVPAEPITFVA